MEPAPLPSRVRPGAGASSISFWWRRWVEQSRSPRATTWPGRVAEELDLDVARRDDLALEVDGAVAEGGRGLARAGDERRGQLVRGDDTAHAAAAAAGRGLDQEREADGRPPRRAIAASWSGPVDWAGSSVPGTCGTSTPRGQAPGGQLVAERRDRRPTTGRRRRARRPPPPGRTRRARTGSRTRDGRPRPRIRGRGCDDCVDAQVALGRRRRAEPDGRVRDADVRRRGIRVGVDGHRLHPHLVRGPDDADGDLAPVGDEDPAERRRHEPSPRRPAGPRRGGASLRKDGAGSDSGASQPSRAAHSGMLPCFLRGFVSRLSASISRAPDQARARLRRDDDVVDVAAGGRDIRVVEARPRTRRRGDAARRPGSAARRSRP